MTLMILKKGGPRVREDCKKYIKDKGSLNLGKVISLSPGNLRYFYLFHSAWTQMEEDDPEDSVLSASLLESISRAETYGCKSLSIPAKRFSQTTFNNIIHFIHFIKHMILRRILILWGSLKVIWFVGNNLSTLHARDYSREF